MNCYTSGFIGRWALLVLVAIAANLHLAAAARCADDVFTAAHLARLRRVTAARVSPNGDAVAYVLSVPRVPFVDDNGPAWTELHVVDALGRCRPFVTGEVNVGAIDWTPDGRGVSFLSKRGDDEHKALYCVPIDGGEARKLVEHASDIVEYSWSPDGRQVAFVAKEEEDPRVKEHKKKGFTQKVVEEDLRPDVVWIAEPAWSDEQRPPPEPGGARKLQIHGSASLLRWSPGGEHLAVGVAPTPLIDDRYMQRKINILDATSGKVLSQLDNPGKLGAMAWSPDGKHIAAIAAADIHDPAPGRLMVGTPPDPLLRDLTGDYHGHVTSAAWQDSRTIMFLGDEGVWSTLGEVAGQGGERHTIIPGGRVVLREMSLSGDGLAAALLGESPRHPTEVFFMRHGETGPRRLTHSNPWLDDLRLAPQQVIRYRSRDGVEIEGLLIRPLDEQPGRTYPLILTVHGGPESHYRNGWLTRYVSPGQVAAARGFAVFLPNYRGSTGRGVPFSKSGQNDYAGREFDDLIDGVDHLIELGLVDRERVGVTGGSYGGFAAAWCATYHSPRFAAAVMFAGVSDHVSKFGTTDIPNEMFLVHSRRWPWEDWDYFRDRSPVFHFRKCRTPLLIVHGEKDQRIHPSQAIELYRYLKSHGKVPVRLVLYPDEGHGNRKAAARLDYSLRVLRWMEHFLQGPGGQPPPPEIDYAPYKPQEEEDHESGDED